MEISGTEEVMLIGAACAIVLGLFFSTRDGKLRQLPPVNGAEVTAWEPIQSASSHLTFDKRTYKYEDTAGAVYTRNLTDMRLGSNGPVARVWYPVDSHAMFIPDYPFEVYNLLPSSESQPVTQRMIIYDAVSDQARAFWENLTRLESKWTLHTVLTKDAKPAALLIPRSDGPYTATEGLDISREVW
jgi:hypothetical protein